MGESRQSGCVHLKKEINKVNNKDANFEEKEKIVFLIFLGQCLPSLRSQLEGTKNFVGTCKRNYTIELLKLSEVFAVNMTRTMSRCIPNECS